MAPGEPRRIRPRRLPHLGIDVHSDILLRLPPNEPKLLFRFAAVCKAWQKLLTSAAFLRRYREHHRQPPMLGCVYNKRFGPPGAGCVMIPRVPAPRLPNDGVGLVALDNRHGRVLFRRALCRRLLVIWDPLAAARHEVVRLPAAFPDGNDNWSAGILCNAIDPCHHVDCHAEPSRVILIGITEELASAYEYNSATMLWTATASVTPPAAATMQDLATTVVNGNMYFRTGGRAIVRYQFVGDEHRLSYIEGPPAIPAGDHGTVLVPGVGGSLGFAGLFVNNGHWFVRMWETEVGAEGAAVAWAQRRDVRLSVDAWRLLGSVECPRRLLIGTRTGHGPISLDLESGYVKILPKPKGTLILIPFMGFYTPREV